MGGRRARRTSAHPRPPSEPTRPPSEQPLEATFEAILGAAQEVEVVVEAARPSSRPASGEPPGRLRGHFLEATLGAGLGAALGAAPEPAGPPTSLCGPTPAPPPSPPGLPRQIAPLGDERRLPHTEPPPHSLPSDPAPHRLLPRAKKGLTGSRQGHHDAIALRDAFIRGIAFPSTDRCSRSPSSSTAPGAGRSTPASAACRPSSSLRAYRGGGNSGLFHSRHPGEATFRHGLASSAPALALSPHARSYRTIRPPSIASLPTSFQADQSTSGKKASPSGSASTQVSTIACATGSASA